jgi:hypothetical protein
MRFLILGALGLFGLIFLAHWLAMEWFAWWLG